MTIEIKTEYGQTFNEYGRNKKRLWADFNMG